MESQKESEYGLLREVNEWLPLYDIIVVHGICQTAWTTEEWKAFRGPKKSTSWIRDTFGYERSEMSHFHYDISGEFPPVLRPGGIEYEAQKLLDGILQWRNFVNSIINQHEEVLRPILFVAHDIGGIIVKQSLILAARNLAKYGSIPYCVKNIVFLGCPHHASTRVLQNSLFQLLAHHRWPPVKDVVNLLPTLAKSIQKVNGEFLDTKLLMRTSIYNIFSEKSPESKSGLYPFPPSACHICVPYEVHYGVPVSHVDLVVGDRTYKTDKAMRNCLGDIRENITKFPYYLYCEIKPAHSNKILLSIAPPLVPGDQDDFGRSLADAVAWIRNSQACKAWQRKRGLHILYIKGGQNMDLLSRRVCEDLSKEPSTRGRSINNVVYFCFNQYDARSNNLRSMITSLLAQLISKYEDVSWTYDLTTMMDNHRAFSDRDLIQLFETFHGCINSADQETTYIIGCLDECDESLFPFLDLISILSKESEKKYRFVLTTSSQAKDRLQRAISASSQAVFEVDLRELQESKETYEPAIKLLYEKKPTYQHVQQKLQALVEACSTIPYFSSILLDWLTFGSLATSRIDIRELVHALSPASPQTFLNTVFRSFGHRESRARRLYKWAVHSFEPLTMAELAVALQLEEEEEEVGLLDADECQTYEDVQRFRRIFNLDMHEVSFSSFWRSITAEGKEIPIAEEAVHAEISRLCIRYLSLPIVIAKTHQMADACMSLSDMPLSRPRQNLISYAVQYWPQHYKFAGQNRPTTEVTSFLQNANCRRAWETVCFSLSNSMIRSQRSYISALPLAAKVGLDDIVAIFVEAEKRTAMFPAHHAMAISEAAQNGHETIVKQLIQVQNPSHEYLSDILCAAAAFGEENMINDLISLAADVHFTNWPDDLFARSVWLGLESTLTLLISKGAIVPINSGESWNVLELAAEARHSRVIEILLQQEQITAHMHANNTKGMLKQSACYGDCRSLQLLLEYYRDTEADRREKMISMHSAIRAGRPLALRLLLDNGADVEDGTEEIRDKRGPHFIHTAKPLLQASIQGHTQCVDVLLEKKANIEAKLGGRTSLWYAATEGYQDICELLLRHGADPNNDPTDDLRILEAAISVDRDPDSRMKLVQLLVDNGSRIYASDESVKKGTDLLSRAVQVGDRALVEYFLDHGLPPNSSALSQAFFKGHEELAKLLLSLDVDPNESGSKELAPFHVAYQSANLVQDMLAAGADVNAKSSSGTILHMACKAGEIDTVKVLLAHNPRPDLENQIADVGDFKAKDGEAGMTALCLACLLGHVRIVRILCDEGANVNHQAKDGRFPLQLAITAPSTSEAGSSGLLVETLLLYRPNLLLKDQDDNTVLQSLTAETPVAMIKTLWRAGAPINAINKDGASVIGMAIEQGNKDAFLFLLSQGAEVNTCGSGGKPLLHVLATQGNWELFKAAVDADADIHLAKRLHYKRTLLYETFGTYNWTEGHRHIAEYLLDEVKDKCSPDDPCENETVPYPIMQAIVYNNVEGFKMLMKYGADPLVEDAMGRRPIHLAARSGPSILRILLETKCVDPMQRTVTGMTPLHFAAARINHVGQEGLLNTLLGIGNYGDRAGIEIDVGDIDDADDDGWTPLMWACKRNYSNIDSILALLDRGADLFATGTVLESNGKTSQWSPLKIARYFGSRKNICDALTPKQTVRILEDGTKQIWNDRDHESRQAIFREHLKCDYCRTNISGIIYKCIECTFSLCYKCYRSRQKLHPGHDFRPEGDEFENDESESVAEKKTSGTDSVNNSSKGNDSDESDSDSDSTSDDGNGGDGENEDEDNSDT